jgi:pimeloyl-ACP methyl ester carboxylesterase
VKTEPTFNLCEVEPGRFLHYVLEGPTDAPVVVYDAGAFGIYADGWWIKERLKDRFQVLLYDRAGMGASSPMHPGVKPSPTWHVADLCRLLDALALGTPIVLVGHSMSGLRLHAFAEIQPERLKGLVFVDALAPSRFNDALFRQVFSGFGLALHAGVLAAEWGLAGFFAPLIPNNFKLPPRQNEDKMRAYGALSHMRASRDEVLEATNCAKAISSHSILNHPLAIFASTRVNSLRKEMADCAQRRNGYGWFGRFEREDHVSILVGAYSEVIALRVCELHACLPLPQAEPEQAYKRQSAPAAQLRV